MTRTFTIRPFDDSCEVVLYKNPTFRFEPGVTVLVGCNRSGKTTLVRRMRDLLRNEGVPSISLLKQNIEGMLSELEFRGDIGALTTQVSRGSTSEGEFAKLAFAHLLPQVRHTIEKATDEAWVFLDGLDSSLSEDQLDQVRDLADAIVESAPPGIETYVVMTTNQFTLAKDRRCLRVTDGKEVRLDTFRAYRSCVLQSARHRERAREVTEHTWQRKYSKMGDSTERVESVPEDES